MDGLMDGYMLMPDGSCSSMSRILTLISALGVISLVLCSGSVGIRVASQVLLLNGM